MNMYIKRIIYLPDADAKGTPEEILARIKAKSTKDVIISDTFLVEDDSGIMVAKEKVIYDGSQFGKSLVFGSI